MTSRLAVQRFADDARERGLAAAARPAEQKRVMDASGRERVPEGPRDVILADDLGEGRWTILAGEDQV